MLNNFLVIKENLWITISTDFFLISIVKYFLVLSVTMNSTKKEIAIIGGGAAGFFAAINCAIKYPEHRVTIFERSNKLLSKVRVSGGGRCNVTHDCVDNHLLVKNYPRGEKQLMNAFARFSVNDTIQWYGERGVELKTEEDGRMFPVSNRSETIVNCLLHEAENYNIKVELNPFSDSDP